MKNTKTQSINTAEQRFRKQVGPADTNGCQLWTGTAFTNGYGQFNVDGTTVYTHRYAWALANKQSVHQIDPGAYVLHATHCSSRLCCAPSHLRLGNAKDNALDRVAAGRSGRGILRNKTAFTTEEKATIARLHMEGLSQYAIAKQMNRAQPTVAYQLARINAGVAGKLRKKAVSISAAAAELSTTITLLYGEPEAEKAA